MASYSYKDVCYDVPQKYLDRFEEKHGREFDDDPNYNGDYWIVVGEWLADLQQELKDLKVKVVNSRSGVEVDGLLLRR